MFGPWNRGDEERWETLVGEFSKRPKKPAAPQRVRRKPLVLWSFVVHEFVDVVAAAGWLYDNADEFFVNQDFTWTLCWPSWRFIAELQELARDESTDGISLLESMGWSIAETTRKVAAAIPGRRYIVLTFKALDSLLDFLTNDLDYRNDAEIMMLCSAEEIAGITRCQLEEVVGRFVSTTGRNPFNGSGGLHLLELWYGNMNIPMPSEMERSAVYTHPTPKIFSQCHLNSTIYFGRRTLPTWLGRPELWFPDAGGWLRDHRAAEMATAVDAEIFRPACSRCGGRVLKWEPEGICCRGLTDPKAVVDSFPKGPPSDLADLILECVSRDSSYARRLNLSLSPVIRNASIGGSRPCSALTRLQGCPYAYDPGPVDNKIVHFVWSPFQTKKRTPDDIDSVLVALITKARLLEQNHMVNQFATLAGDGEVPELVVQYARDEVDLNTVTVAIANYSVPWPQQSVVVGTSRVDHQRLEVRSYTSDYDKLVYPLLFFDGTGGFGADEYVPGTLAKKFKCFLFQPPDSFAHRSGLLLEELIADTYGRYFDNKLTYAFNHIKNLVREGELQADGESQFGRRLFVPASVPGSKAYFTKLNYDAAALTLRLGNCTWFLTVTCNPKWLDLVSLGVDDYALHSFEVARVFKLRIQTMMKILKSSAILGTIKGYLYRYEYQNRGLPHVHILLWTDLDLEDPAVLDQYVTCELPPDDESESSAHWRTLAEKFQLHNHSSRCGFPTTGYCSYNYPQPIIPVTVPGGRRIHLRRRKMQDRLVVPYNPVLTNLVRCHTDLEPVSSTQCPAYTLKYTSKDSGHADLRSLVRGRDQVLYHGQPVDDDFHYWMSTKVTGTAECVMELTGSDRYSISPTVLTIGLHLENGRILATDDEADPPTDPGLTDLLRYFRRPTRPEYDMITLLQYFEQYQILVGMEGQGDRDQGDLNGRQVAVVRPYQPTKRKVARFRNYLPSAGELYYLRILLTHLPARSFDELFVCHGVRYPTYHDAAIARGYIPATHDGIFAVREAISLHIVPVTVRQMCVFLMEDGFLTIEQLNRDRELIDYLTDDINRAHNDTLSPEQKWEHLNLSISTVLRRHGQDVATYHLEYSEPEQPIHPPQIEAHPLTLEQEHIVTNLTTAIMSKRGKIFYLQGRAGTGKTYTVCELIRRLRDQGLNVCACGSTGIAASQYQGGQTIHRCFRMGVDDSIDDTGVFRTTVGRNTRDARRLLNTDLFLFDEASMITIELLDRIAATFRFLAPESEHDFAGANILLVGDFLQLPPISSDQVPVFDRLLLASHIWPNVSTFSLSRPMRCPDLEYHAFVTEVANGHMERFHRWSDVHGIQVTSDFETALHFILDGVDNADRFPLDRMWIAGTNRAVSEVNARIQADRAGTAAPREAIAWHTVEKDHRSIGTELTAAMAMHYLESHDDPSMPPAHLYLYMNDPIFLLRNLDTSIGLVKGRRANVVHVGPSGRTLQMTLADGSHHTLPRICFRGSLNGLPFLRRQIPVRLAYAGTVHRAQGETLSRVVVDLRHTFWEHGQLYVALSRVRSPDGLLVLLPNLPQTESPEIHPIADARVVQAILTLEEDLRDDEE